ncbi:MAG: C_GCAxxG_C_C family protein [Promethearchaeota archaeon]|nr:MAG: C_GCAxxG_C_C family protein [Candidatus Lokiarchaeota archaeon]
MEQKVMKGEIDLKFDEALKQFEEILPKADPTEGGCADGTLGCILSILEIEDDFINNIMLPLSGGLGGYKSQKGWSGPCGAVIGGCAAVGAILGGKKKEKIISDLIPVALMKSSQFAKDFENEFGSVICPTLSGYDFSDPNATMNYIENDVWGKTCYKYVLWAIDHIRNLMNEELKTKW